MSLRIPIALCLTLLCLSPPAHAEPQVYELDKSASEVRFTYEFSGAETSGTMPIAHADIRLDLANIPASSATVTLNAAKAKTALGFARKPLLSETVLDTDSFPTIHFKSTQVSGSLVSGGKIAGDITLRDITRPIVLDAQVFRQQGSKSGDLSALTLHLTGTLDRLSFGADGFQDLVGNIVHLNIRARIQTKK